MRRQGIIPSVHGAEGDIDIATPLGKIDPEPIGGPRCSADGGERLVQKELRRTLLKYKLHTDQELFDKAYAYIRQYY